MITLLTDFGLQDPFVGVMKGVIWSIAPQVQIVDLTHDIAPQNITAGALAIADAAPYFPQGTIHVCVVDPGVGTVRRPMLAALGGQYYICPDNGLLSLLIEKSEDLTTPPVYFELNKPHYFLSRISNSFHGRDIFSPVAAHLASGVPCEQLGDPFEKPVTISLPKPQKTENGWLGQVIHIDHFGNLATNLGRRELPLDVGVNIHVKNHVIHGASNTFGNNHIGDLIAMLDSSGRLAVSVVNGSAARKLDVSIGEPVNIELLSSTMGAD